nr:hypothetical protein [Sicyoidochytrium minutum DNA virus]
MDKHEKPSSYFGYFPKWSAHGIGSLTDVTQRDVTHDAILRFDAEARHYEPRSTSEVIRPIKITEAKNVLLTPAQVLGRLVFRSCAGDDRVDVFPSAAELVGAMSNAQVGDAFYFKIVNAGDANTADLMMDSAKGYTVLGHTTVEPKHIRTFLLVLKSVKKGEEAVEVLSLGTAEM